MYFYQIEVGLVQYFLEIGWGLFGCCFLGCQYGFDYVYYEFEGVFFGEDDVDQWEDDEGVDEEVGQYCYYVVGQLFKYGV